MDRVRHQISLGLKYKDHFTFIYSQYGIGSRHAYSMNKNGLLAKKNYGSRSIFSYKS